MPVSGRKEPLLEQIHRALMGHPGQTAVQLAEALNQPVAVIRTALHNQACEEKQKGYNGPVVASGRDGHLCIR